MSHPAPGPELVFHLIASGRHLEAYSAAERFAAGIADLEERATWWHTCGVGFERTGNYGCAADAYQAGVRLEQIEETLAYFLHNNLGYSLLQIGKFDCAERECRAAIEVNPLRHNAWKNLGLALQGQGLYPEAARALLVAARACFADPRALAHLESLLQEHGEIVAATDPRMKAKLDELKSLTGAPAAPSPPASRAAGRGRSKAESRPRPKPARRPRPG